jgi:phosphate acetyltransferase
VQYHKSAAVFIGRMGDMTLKATIEQAGHLAVIGHANPGAMTFGIDGVDGADVPFLPHLRHHGNTPDGLFITVMGQNKIFIADRQKGYRAHGYLHLTYESNQFWNMTTDDYFCTFEDNHYRQKIIKTMSNNLYVAAVEADSGKSLIVLGIMDILSRHVKRVGFFRPLINAGQQHDHDIDLIAKRYNLSLPYDAMYGVTSGEALDLIQAGDMDTLYTNILNKYKRLEPQCDFILCEGTDFTTSLQTFEFNFNARLANNLGAPILPVVNGKGKTVTDIADTIQIVRNILSQEKSTYMGLIVNRVGKEYIKPVMEVLKKLKSADELDFVIPEQELLQTLTMRQIGQSLNAEMLYGDDNVLNYDVSDFKVGAMTIEYILKNLSNGMVVITPSDRSDVLLGLFMTLLSDNFPKITGLILTGPQAPDESVMKLVRGIRKLPVAVFKVDTDTYTTAMNVSRIKPSLSPDNERRIAFALGHFEAYVDVDKLKEKIAITRSGVVTPVMFEYELFERARAYRKHIVLPEAMDERILRAAEILIRRNVVDITLLGNEEEIFKKTAALHLKLNGVNIIDPYDNDLINEYGATYYNLRKDKGITKESAHEIMRDVSYLGTMMVYKGHADGMVSGAAHTTQHTIRPAFEFIKTKPGFSIVSSSFFMCFEDRVLVYADCAVNPNPNSEQLADIAVSSADTAAQFGIEPRIAMLSYSTGESGKGEDVEKVRKATEIARQRRPDLKIEGPIQYDAAIDLTVAQQKMPGSEVAGRATVFIFPDLNTGNNTYKAVQRASGAVAVGPVLQGLNKPVNDLSRGCTIKDIVNTVMITAIQAQMG